MNHANRILIFSLAILTWLPGAQAQSTREQLTQMVEQLQKSPDDNALREKVIKLARQVKPSPAVPEEARRAFVMGNTYQKGAKSPEDSGLAVKAYQEATSAAPWWGDAYYNLSVALESAKRFDEAKAALTFYLMIQPKDAAAKERLYALDAKKVLAGTQQAAAARTQREDAEQRFAASIEGARYVCQETHNSFYADERPDVTKRMEFEIRNRTLNGANVTMWISPRGMQEATGSLRVGFRAAWGYRDMPLQGKVTTFTSKFDGRPGRIEIFDDSLVVTEVGFTNTCRRQ
jgi:hypothetical protein